MSHNNVNQNPEHILELVDKAKKGDKTSLQDIEKLKATKMTSPDIRAGISLLIAALSANGTSTIHNIEQIDRGYENIDDRLKSIGASIERFK